MYSVIISYLCFSICKLPVMTLFMLLGIVGPTEVILIVVIALLLFGGKKIPELMKGIGQGAREFKKGLAGDPEEEKKKEEVKKD
jgi:sec-independent protein translocase protein TatA